MHQSIESSGGGGGGEREMAGRCRAYPVQYTKMLPRRVGT